ncbi:MULTISPECIES: TIR domain-containing protein [unclassified Pseudomonas]|uniref:TIR domain-containing protein n=1 Tax=unclassified Pseudomonas TaxID=196821 RepID=UPI0012E3F7E4
MKKSHNSCLNKDNKIFVSYTTRDSIINMESLASLLHTISSLGKPFIDLIHNNSPMKQARVKSELQNSTLLLLLETASVEKSQWVQWEIKMAKSCGIPVKSIKIHNIMPTKQQLIVALNS